MILYLDTSAIVKRYIRESGSQDVENAVTFATYDKNLWATARQVGLETFPPKLVED